MALREPDAFNRNRLAYAVRVRARIMQYDDATQRVSDQTNRKLIDDVQKRREVEHVLGNAVHGAWGPCAVPVSAQVERVNMVALAQGPRHPVPAAGMVQPTVDQHKG